MARGMQQHTLNQIRRYKGLDRRYRSLRRKRRKSRRVIYPPAQRGGLQCKSDRKKKKREIGRKKKSTQRCNRLIRTDSFSCTSSPSAGSSSTVAETSRNVGAESSPLVESSTTETTQEVSVVGPSVPTFTAAQNILIDELVAAIKNSSGEEKERLQNQLNDVVTQIREQHELEQNAEAQLQWLSQSGKKVIKVNGNGSCLFESVALQVEFPPHVSDPVDYLRQQACDYMAENKPFFQKYLPGVNYDEFVRKLRSPTEFADHQVIVALSAVLGREIHIYEHVWKPPYVIKCEGIDTSGPPITICRQNGNHYVGLESADEPQDDDDGVVEREAVVASTIDTSVASVPPLAIDAPTSLGGEVASDTSSDHSPPVSEDTYQLLLKCGGRTVTIDNVTSSTTIDTLKDKIHHKTAFPPDTQRLTDGKNVLEVGRTLLNSGLVSGSTIYLCQRLLGSGDWVKLSRRDIGDDVRTTTIKVDTNGTSIIAMVNYQSISFNSQSSGFDYSPILRLDSMRVTNLISIKNVDKLVYSESTTIRAYAVVGRNESINALVEQGSQRGLVPCCQVHIGPNQKLYVSLISPDNQDECSYLGRKSSVPEDRVIMVFAHQYTPPLAEVTNHQAQSSAFGPCCDGDCNDSFLPSCDSSSADVVMKDDSKPASRKRSVDEYNYEYESHLHKHNASQSRIDKHRQHHPDAPPCLPQPQMQKVCFQYRDTGHCSFGERCKYSHVCQAFLNRYQCDKFATCQLLHVSRQDLTKQEELKRHAEVLKMKAEAIKDQEMVVEIESEIMALEHSISPNELQLKAEGLDEMAESIKDQEERAKLAAELEAEVKALELPISRNELRPSNDDPSFALAPESAVHLYTKREIDTSAKLTWLLRTQRNIINDPSRDLKLPNDTAIETMGDNCACCNRRHIPGQNKPNVIDRINSANRTYSPDNCWTLCNSDNNLMGTLVVPEYLMHVLKTCDRMPYLIHNFCPEGIDTEDDLRAYVEQEGSRADSLISQGIDDYGEIDLHPTFFPSSKKMTTLRRGGAFDRLFVNVDNEDEGIDTRAMVVDLYTRRCINCGLLCCSGANREDNDLSYAENLRLGLIWPMCWACNCMLKNYPYPLYLVKMLDIRDHVEAVGVETILSRGDVPLPVSVREVELEGAFEVGGLACLTTIIPIQTTQAEYSIASAIEHVLVVTQELLPEDTVVGATLAMSNTLVEYNITFLGNINTVSDIQQSVEQTLTNNSTLESITDTAIERSSWSSILSSFTIIKNARFKARSRVVTKQMSGFTSLSDGLKFMTNRLEQRKPVLVKFPEFGDLQVAFRSLSSAELMRGYTISRKNVTWITPFEYHQYLEDNPDSVVQFRNAMGVKTSLHGDLISELYISDDDLENLEQQLIDKAVREANGTTTRRTRRDMKDFKHLLEGDDHVVHKIIKSGKYKEVYTCYSFFDKEFHPVLFEEAIVRCNKCGGDFFSTKHEYVDKTMWPGTINGAPIINHAASCQDVYAADVEVERYDYEAAAASVPEGKVAPSRHFKSEKWNHYYFFEEDIEDVNDPNSFKTAINVYCKHCKGTYKRNKQSGSLKWPNHNCWSSNDEDDEDDDDDETGGFGLDENGEPNV